MANTSTALLCIALALLAGAQAQESLTFAPTNATGPFGTRVTGAPKGSILSIQFAEDGSIIASNVTAGGNNGTSPSAVVYPVGRTHLQYNPTCKPAKFAAFFPVNPPSIMTVNLNGTKLVSAVDKATKASPEAVTALMASLKEIALAAATPIPAGYSGAGPFTPALTGTFAFPLSLEAQMQDECLKTCGLSL